ncbi:MAG: hypothetical protein ACI4SQ_02350 [Eubacterium sp.]
MEDDTIKLLRECNAGLKMGISSINDVLDDVQNGALKGILKDSLDIHCRLETETNEYLKKYHDIGKEPAPIAKAMAKVKSNFKTMGDNPDCSIASFITDGCNMGIKSLHRYLNQYPAADKGIKHLTKQIIITEEKLLTALQRFL